MTHSNADETVERPRRGADARPGAQDGVARPATLTSSLAVRREQSERVRALLVAAIFVAGSTLASFLLPGVATGGPAELPAAAGLAAVIVFSIAMLMRYPRPRLISDAAATGFGVVATVAILAVEFHVGIFTPAVMASFVTLYYFSLGDSARVAWGVFLALAIGYAVIAALYVLDAGGARASMFSLDRPTVVPMIALTVVVETYLALTFWLGRFSRRATLEAMERLESAHRQIREREALLAEARADLDREIDAGKVGRMTGRAVGPFLAHEVIGRGAMGEVYRAVHEATGAERALKVLHPLAAAQPSQVERFFREVRISSDLDSPHVVRARESGVLDDGSPWLAMDMLEGRDLAAILREKRRLSLDEAVDLVTQVARGLDVAREAGIVHRDVKPQNLFLSEDESGRAWKVLDFGVSTLEASDGTLTRGAAVGTPSYMSPEQTRGQKVDHRSDVFSLGAIAYRAVTGRPAFTGADHMHTMYNVAHRMPVRPGSIVRTPEDVDLVLAVALAKNRDDRIESATAFATALRDAARGELDGALRAAAERLVAARGWGADPDDTPRSRPTQS